MTPLLKMAPVLRWSWFPAGGRANTAGRPGPLVGAEVSGLRSVVQGAPSGPPGLKCGAVFNQGIQALGFFSLSSFLPWQREGPMGMGIQVTKGLDFG